MEAGDEVGVGGVDADGEEQQRRRHHRCVPEEVCASVSVAGAAPIGEFGKGIRDGVTSNSGQLYVVVTSIIGSIWASVESHMG